MAQFVKLGSGGVICHKSDNASPKQEAMIQRIMMPHKAAMSGNVYGMNQFDIIMANPAYDTSKWPKIPAMSLCNDIKSQAKYYQNMMENMIENYMQNAITKGHMKSYTEIVKQTPLFDVSQYARDESLEKYSDQDVTLSPDEYDHIRNYGWTAFFPCLNEFTVRTNNQKYYHIKVLAVNEVKKTILIDITDYAGNSRHWTREIQCIFQIKFDWHPENGELSIDGTQGFLAHGYEDFLLNHVDEMNWTKEQKTLWYDGFDIHTIQDAVMVEMSPTPAILNDNNIPEDMKSPVKFMMWDKNQQSYLNYANMMDIQIDSDSDRVIQLYTTYLLTRHRTKFLQMMPFINMELLCEPAVRTQLATSSVSKLPVGKMFLSTDMPVNIRIPTLKNKGKEGKQ